MNLQTNRRQGEKGFTLVELAIVMIIIGLLIGGILKGQELIANARLASAVTKVKAIDSAINTFKDSYAGLPGDLTTANTRLPNCANRCANNGNGNNQIGVSPGAAQAAGSENTTAWAQLAATDLIGGIQVAQNTTVVEGGVTHPDAEIPGQIYIGYFAGNGNPGDFAGPAANVRAGQYLLVHNGVGAAGATVAAAAGTRSLTPSQAYRIDLKLDDGMPNTGSVLAQGATGAAGCTLGATNTDAYTLANAGTACGSYVRIQQ